MQSQFASAALKGLAVRTAFSFCGIGRGGYVGVLVEGMLVMPSEWLMLNEWLKVWSCGTGLLALIKVLLACSVYSKRSV